MAGENLLDHGDISETPDLLPSARALLSRVECDILAWESAMVGRHIDAGMPLTDGSRASLPEQWRGEWI